MFSGPRWQHETHITLSWGQAGEIDAALREASGGMDFDHVSEICSVDIDIPATCRSIAQNYKINCMMGWAKLWASMLFTEHGLQVQRVTLW